MNSLEGQLLVAVPKLRDAGFFHSVVLMIRHSEDGAFGLTLNRPSGTRLADVWSQIFETECPWPDNLLFTGGPVPGPPMALHDGAEAGEIEATPGVFFTASPEMHRVLLDRPPGRAQFYAGYCGWAPGQLENELAIGSWITVPANAEHVFAADDELWKKVTGEITSAAILSTLHIKHVPPESDSN